jgi:hypothetical protein
MATSSIFRNIEIKSDADCSAFINAMESAEKAANNRVRKPTKIRELKTKDEIKAFFHK